VRWALRTLYFLPADASDRLHGRSEDLVPPKSKIFTGSVDSFRQSGDQLVGRLVTFAGLAPDGCVLDVGCGVGRLAVALTRYLGPDGRYEGIDIVPSGIKWCNENIAAKYPNFRFTLADVYNMEYHPGGRMKPSEYTFPYDEDLFDLAVFASVFTHMLPPDMERYIAETSRVLKTGGRCYATYSLIDEESQAAMESGRSRVRFKHHFTPYWTVSNKVPELGIAYDEPYVRHVFERLGFSGYHIFNGTWSGRLSFKDENGTFVQDVVVTTKA
jgi:ubiquinone/menaquinone biosynthesis C-methylase UbiE